MAKIPLRSYVKDIENLIERGEIEQAIAHAKSILNSYPKHIDTYRLLGKAYLESQRYSEAADILQRVLSVIPDDFVSQLGMSIIREDEGNKDAAIWHMERAYEVQPFNPAVQDELRRLYGRRDGSEPPKIRLTRGALIRMYARGELYPQAIAETRAALAEDPQRFDLLVMLARLYYLSNLKVEATEVCSTLISKLPYCLEANQILTEILPGTSRAEDTQKFQQRIYALDPYTAFVSPSAPTPGQVPDQAVMVEQFIWDASMNVDSTPEWARNVGVQWEEEAEEEALPDWINTLKPDTQPQETTVREEPAAGQEESISFQSSSDELVPDWMKEAGWTTTDRRADDIMAELPDEGEAEIAPAEIPDWIQAIAPGESSSSTGEEERNDWLDTLLTPESGTNGKQAELPAVEEIPANEAEDAGLPDWLSGMAEGGQALEFSPQDSEEDIEAPDWLSGLEAGGQTQEGISSEDLETEEVVPDWLSGVIESDAISDGTGDDADQARIEESGDSLQTEWPVQETGEAQPDEEREVPDWLSAMEDGEPEEAAALSDEPDWLSSLQPDSSNGQEASLEETGDSLDVSGLEPATAWLQDDQVQEDEAAVEPAIDSIPAWLQGIGESQPPSSGEEALPDWMMGEPGEIPVEAEALTDETPQENPDWLASLETDSSINLQEELTSPAVESDITNPETEMSQPDIESLGEMNLDDAMAWLEGLAARQGADEATLTIAPEDRKEVAPAWLADNFTEISDSSSTTEAESGETPLDEAALLASLEDTSPVRVRPVETESETEGVAVAEEDGLTAVLEPGTEEETVTLAFESQSDTEDVVTAAEDMVAVEQENSTEEAFVLLETETQPVETEPVSETQEDQLEAAAPPDFTDIDAAMAWLEGLAAKQGADEATLTTTPEERRETPPDWLQQEAAPQQDETASSPEPVQSEQETLPSWMQKVDEEPVQETTQPEWMVEAPEPGQEEVVELAQSLSLESNVEESETEKPDATAETQTAAVAEQTDDFDDAFAWLESLAAKQGADEATLINAPENRQETAPDWVQQEQARAVEEEFTVDPISADEEGELGEAEILLESAPEATEIEAENAKEIPQWLQSSQDEDQQEHEEAEIPDWLKSVNEEEPQGKATTDWVPAEEAGVEEQTAAEEDADKESESFPEWLQAITEETGDESQTVVEWGALAEEEEETLASPVLDSVDLDISAAWAPEEELSQPEAGYTAADSPTVPVSLEAAYKALDRGDILTALEGYRQLIQENQYLAEVIQQLRDALYRYPVDIDIWQALGDAYAQNNQLQEALEAYTKAEDLLR